MKNTTIEVVMKTISVSEASRHFPSVLRDVAAGESITFLSRGKPVAMISPFEQRQDARRLARHGLLTRLEKCQPIGKRDWSRGDLYEND